MVQEDGVPLLLWPDSVPPGILMEHLPLEVWTETRELARIRPQSRSGV